MVRELQRLQTQHQKIAELFLAGVTVSDIARELGLRANSVSRICQSTLFQDHVARRRKSLQVVSDEESREAARQAKRKLARAGETAVETLEELMGEDQAPGVRLKSAAEVLKQAFQGGPGGGSKGEAPVVMTQVNVRLLQSALREADAPIEGKVVAEVAAPEEAK